MVAEALGVAEHVAAAANAIGEGYPTGLCAIASWELRRLLMERGLVATFVLGRFMTNNGGREDHAWVRVGDVILDVTARQFGLDDVEVTSVNDRRYRPKSTDQAAFAQVNRCFPEEQQVTEINLERLREALRFLALAAAEPSGQQPPYTLEQEHG